MFTVKSEKNILCASVLTENDRRATATLEMETEFAARTVSDWINNAQYPEALVDIGFHICHWSHNEPESRRLRMSHLVNDIIRMRFNELEPKG